MTELKLPRTTKMRKDCTSVWAMNPAGKMRVISTKDMVFTGFNVK